MNSMPSDDCEELQVSKFAIEISKQEIDRITDDLSEALQADDDERAASLHSSVEGIRNRVELAEQFVDTVIRSCVQCDVVDVLFPKQCPYRVTHEFIQNTIT